MNIKILMQTVGFTSGLYFKIIRIQLIILEAFIASC